MEASKTAMDAYREQTTWSAGRPKGKRQRRQRPSWWQQFWQRFQGRWLFHWGAVFLQRGQYQRATNLLERALALLAEDPFVRLHLAWAHWYLGHPVTAQMHAVKATELLPNNPAPWVFTGKLLTLRGKGDEAERMFRKALALAPENFIAKSWLALVLIQSRRYDEALKILQQFPVADDPYLQARLVLLLERLAMAKGERKGTTMPLLSRQWRLPLLSNLVAYALRWRGERLLEDGDWDGAAKWLSTAVQWHPSDAWARLLLAIALLEGGYWTIAQQVLEGVPETIAERRLVLGALLVRQGKEREGIKVLNACDPNHPLTRYYMAVALSRLGEKGDKCMMYLEKLYREDPAALRQRLRELVRWLTSFPPSSQQ